MKVSQLINKSDFKLQVYFGLNLVDYFSVIDVINAGGSNFEVKNPNKVFVNYETKLKLKK